MDINRVKTFKSGYFTFSRNFSNNELNDHIIETRVLYDTVKDLPILPELAARIEEEVIMKSIFGTAAIEGNPLSEEDVNKIYKTPAEESVLHRGLLPKAVADTIRKDLKAKQEIMNLKSAYNFVRESSKHQFMLDEILIKKIHGIVMADIEHPYNVPGRYRNHLVKVGDIEHGGIYTPPKILKDINTLMREFVKWINNEDLLELEPILRAALAHYHLALIHPFADGNGRTARLVEAVVLLSAGIKYAPMMLSNFYYRNIDDYFWAFSNSIRNKEKNDVTPFLSFVLRGFTESLKEIKERVILYIRMFTLRDYYHFLKKNRNITQRQFDLLSILLENPTSFKLKDLKENTTFAILYRHVSERTARRDLKSLHGRGLLLIDNNKYRLNDRVLG